jgi:large subunit ribosomal protein L22
MPQRGYSVIDLDKDNTVKASGRDLRISPKSAREVCVAVKGMKLDKAKEYLEQVINKTKSVPFRRHNKKIPHRRGQSKIASGRYPVKAARKILQILESAESNAIFKGFDTEQMKVTHISSYRGTKIKRYVPRAMGRASPKVEQLCQVEIFLEQQIGGEK